MDVHYCPEHATLLAGVGGTVTVLASIDRDLAEYDPAALEGWYIERGGCWPWWTGSPA